jgi:hypothetical protein
MGRRVTITIDTDNVPVEDGRAFREMVTVSDFFKLPPEFLSPQSRPDQFHYKLTVEDNSARHTIEMDETEVPEKLQPLITRLLAEARQARYRTPG